MDDILRPAFEVEGECDPSLGPPTSGIEYLRQVRWEANQLPEVTISSVILFFCAIRFFCNLFLMQQDLFFVSLHTHLD
jgi:hypothetical protein